MKILSLCKYMIAAAALVFSASGSAQTFAATWTQFYTTLPVNQEYIDIPSVTPYAHGAFYHNCGGSASSGYYYNNGQNNVFMTVMQTGGYMTGLHVNNNQ